MEQWEIDLRKKLEEELEDGYYRISNGDFTIGTGKGGYIEYQVALVRAANNFISNIQITSEDLLSGENYTHISEKTLEEFEEDIREILRKKKENGTTN